MLKVHTRNLGNVAILCLQGRIVTGETTPLRDAVKSQPEVSTVVLDFAQVNTIDAGGLGVMLELRAQTQAKGIGFKLMNVSKLINSVLEMTRLNSVFEVVSAADLSPVASRARGAHVLELARCA